MKKRVLFLCTANSSHSQMAEGLVNHFMRNKIDAYSAGNEATYVNQNAIKVMGEIGIDISRQQSKNVSAFGDQTFDYTITLCGEANDTCPLYIGGANKTHIGFDDPAKTQGKKEEILCEFRRVRDEIKENLTAFFQAAKIFN
jgi:arsenate reductase (thioredoxin)